MTSGTRLRRSLVLFVAALVGVSAVALVAGWLYGRTNPEGAAARLIGDLVVEEPVGADPGDPAAPTSGDADGEPTCGIRTSPVERDTQLATLSAGAVAIQFRPDAVDREDREALSRLAGPGSDVLVAPNPELRTPVSATAWTRRLALEVVAPEFLRAFVVAYAEEGACGG